MDENNMNFNNVNNPENSNSETKGLGITGPQNFDTKEYTSPYIDPNYKPPRPKKAESSNLGKWAFALSLLGCTTIIGAILAIVDISKKDGKKKDYAIGALCVCGIYFIVFAVGKIKKTNTRNTNETVTSTQVPGDDTISSNEVAEVTTEMTTEATTENVSDVITDDNYQDYVRTSEAKNGFDSNTNKIESIDIYNIEIPSYFGKQWINDKGVITYMPIEKENEYALLRFIITDMDDTSYDNREEDVSDLSETMGYLSYDYNDASFSGIQAIEIYAKAKNEEKEDVKIDNRQAIKAGTYFVDTYDVVLYDAQNNKVLIVLLDETFGTNYDYIEDVKKILNTLTVSEESTNSSGVSQDFKDMLDAYEEFMDEYIEFMKLYNQNPTDAELMSKYFDILTEYTQYASTISKLENSEMTDEEAAYYLEVVNRVNQKLIEAGISN